MNASVTMGARSLLALLPGRWVKAAHTLTALGVVSWRRVGGVMGLHVARVFVEAFGIALLFPLLQFVEQKQNIAVLAAGSRMWRTIAWAFGLIGLPVTLVTLSIVVFLLICVRQAVVYKAVVELDRLKEQVTERLRQRLFGDVLAAQASYIRQIKSGHFITLVNQQAQTTGSAVRNFVTLFTIYLSFLTYGGMLMIAAPLVTSVAIVLGVLVIGLMKRYADAARAISRKTIAEQSEYTQFLGERFRGWRLVKLSSALEREKQLNNATAARLAKLYVQTTIVSGRIQLIVTPLTIAAALVGLYIAVEYSSIGVSEITVFVVVLVRLVPILEQFLNTRQVFATIEAALHSVESVWNGARAAQERLDGARPFHGLREGIAFEHVSYRYSDDAEPAVIDVSAFIPAGQITALVGRSGSGKSTLVDLVPRIIEPQSGRVLIDGQPVSTFDMASLRSGIAYVSQSSLLFDDTVAANIRYARPDASDAEVTEAARLGHAEDFIFALPNGYETLLGESGEKLSGGQRQRIALARAFLAKASILIFDEPTSSLDYESEQAVRAALRQAHQAGGRTIIIIAHRPSTIADADHAIVMSNGRVSSAGPMAQVQRQDAWFAEMIEPRLLEAHAGDHR